MGEKLQRIPSKLQAHVSITPNQGDYIVEVDAFRTRGALNMIIGSVDLMAMTIQTTVPEDMRILAEAFALCADKMEAEILRQAEEDGLP